MVHTWRKLSHIRQTLREEHGGVCFEWEFVPQENMLYILDGDIVRHGLNRDLSFKAEHRAENIQRIGRSTWERTEESTSIINLFAIVLSLFLWPPEVFPFQCHHLLFHSFVEYILLLSIPLLPPFNFDYLYLMSIIRPILKILHPLLLSYGPYTQTCPSLYFSDGLNYWELRYFYFLYIFVGFFLFRKMSI
ncbi:uncharacterized protein LOC126591191 [Malus sylvestris]|uniref:uncharacterized protein LOC126591191 n=1 Tax=Malus sylvestris TaxID=3752 RepID=UPI0021AD0176|nr:uncharacterized protein LOC126591191 [Malus sylvestris]